MIQYVIRLAAELKKPEYFTRENKTAIYSDYQFKDSYSWSAQWEVFMHVQKANGHVITL